MARIRKPQYSSALRFTNCSLSAGDSPTLTAFDGNPKVLQVLVEVVADAGRVNVQSPDAAFIPPECAHQLAAGIWIAPADDLKNLESAAGAP